MLLESLYDVAGYGLCLFVGYCLLVECGHPFTGLAHDIHNVLGSFDAMFFSILAGKRLVGLDDIASVCMASSTMFFEFGLTHLVSGSQCSRHVGREGKYTDSPCEQVRFKLVS